MLSATFVVPAIELPLIEKSLDKCPGVSLIGATPFSSGGQHYYDVFLTHQDSADLYQLGYFVALEQEGGDAR